MTQLDSSLRNTGAPTTNTVGLACACESCIAIESDSLVRNGDFVDQGEGFGYIR